MEKRKTSLTLPRKIFSENRRSSTSNIAKNIINTFNESAKTSADNRLQANTYNESEINSKLSSGYINIHSSLWDYIPVESHIMYTRKGQTSLSERFRPGGFVKCHYTGEDGLHYMHLETKPHGKKGQSDYIDFTISYSDI